MRKSKLTKFEYILDHILFGMIIAYDLIYVVLPWLMPIAYVNRSFKKIIICLLVASVIGCMISYKNRRTVKNVLSDFILGIVIYIIWMFGKYKPNFIRWTLHIAVIITRIGIALILYLYSTKKKNRKNLLLKYCFKLIRYNDTFQTRKFNE